MASLAALDSVDTDEEEAGMAVTPHPEMLDSKPGPIPDTVAEFMSRAVESDVQRYHRERGERGEDTSAEATSSVDEVRPGALLSERSLTGLPLHSVSVCGMVLDCGSGCGAGAGSYAGLDDINEFEAELEAPDKWARRFRILRESEKDSLSKQGGGEGENNDVENTQSAIDEEAAAAAPQEPKDEADVAQDEAGKDVEASGDGVGQARDPESSSSGDEPEEGTSKKGKGSDK